MDTVSQIYDLPATPEMECRIEGRIELPGVVMELHRYRFFGRQEGIFTSHRGFLDLALSPRPGRPRGGFESGGEGALGEIIFVPEGSRLHTRWGDGEQKSICCGFDGAGFDLADARRPTADVGLALLDVRSAAVRAALRRIAGEIAQPGFCSELLVQAMWLEAAIELQRYLRLNSGDRSARSALSRRQMERINERIEMPGKPPSIAEMAKDCGLSTRHFFRSFRAATGETLTSYVTERKIFRAKERLSQTELAIKVIAWECGFDSPAAFSAAFRKATGVTPRQFRDGLMH
jgi:AraC family transcriptional regulator